MKITSSYNLRQNIKQRRCRNENVFSRLPDDVIISHILSRLMPREAGKCCFISRRWRSLWKTSVTCRFVFTSLWGKHILLSEDGVEKESQRFVSWVNKFLDLPQHSPTIDEFIVRFDLDSSYSCDINKWLNFAFRKEVGRLELDLSPYLCHYDKDYYAFPSVEALSALLGLESNHGMNLSPFCRAGLHNLRDICFKHVNVDGEAVEYLLSKCHSLERLSVKSSNTLINLNVNGEFVALKHLKIVDCDNAEKIKISVSSLVSLKYSGSRAALCMVYVPSLSEACIGGDYCRAFLRGKAANLKCVSQLKKLKLDMTYKVVKKCVNYPLKFPNFISLEQLEVKMEMYNGLFLLWPTILIKAAPALHTFVIKLKYVEEKLISTYFKQRENYNNVLVDRMVVGHTPSLTQKVQSRIMSASKQQHECLKVVEIRNFVGNESDLILARHLLRMPFPSLEKLILFTSPYSPLVFRTPRIGLAYQERSRRQARLVRGWSPSSIQVMIH